MEIPDLFGRSKNGADALKNPGINYKPVTLHDTNEVTLMGYKGKEDYPRGFIPNQTGTLNLVSLLDEEAPISVVAGVLYPIRFKIAKANGSVDVTSLTALA